MTSTRRALFLPTLSLRCGQRLCSRCRHTAPSERQHSALAGTAADSSFFPRSTSLHFVTLSSCSPRQRAILQHYAQLKLFQPSAVRLPRSKSTLLAAFSLRAETSQVFAAGLFTGDLRKFRFTQSNCRMIANSEL